LCARNPDCAPLHPGYACHEQAIGFYQILNQGNGNLTNQPLKPKAQTLTRTDLITFQ
jgi:hypothetical protein